MPQKLERKSAKRVAHLSCNGAGLEHGVELLPEQRGVVVQGSQDNVQLVNLNISHVDPDQFDLRKIPNFKTFSPYIVLQKKDYYALYELYYLCG